MFADDALSLERSNYHLSISEDVSISDLPDIEPLPVFDTLTGQTRFVPLTFERTAPGSVVHFGEMDDPYTGAPILSCRCSPHLGEAEFVVSEVPVYDPERATYVSVNDESYKAVMELIDYPHSNVDLNTVSFSELAYVYNETALELFLNAKGFELVMARGFMNSVDHPGFRDSQFFVAKESASGQFYVVIRGTSRAKDLETSVETEMIDWGNAGKALKGYGEVARHVYEETTPFFQGQLAGKPLIVTGHSLGGAVAILASILWLEDGMRLEVPVYAPPPVGDQTLAAHYGSILDNYVTSYFLPNEELLNSERATFLGSLGKRTFLEEVGTTAGAAHFVINYLKSMLLKHDYSRTWYEHSMPHCVVVKYPCFLASDQGTLAENIARLVPDCAFYDQHCLDRAEKHVKGYSRNNMTVHEYADLARRNKMLLATRKLDRTQRALLFRQLEAYEKQTGNAHTAARYARSAESLISEITSSR